jgi:hypothetical protein
MSKLKYILIPLIIYVCIELMLIFLPKLTNKQYLSLGTIVFLSILFLILTIIFSIIFIKILPKIMVLLGLAESEANKIPYADIREIRMYNIDFFKEDPTNPINLELANYRQEGILTIGKENERTEIYVGKYKDINPIKANKDIYYIANRVTEPNKLRIAHRTYQVSYDEERKIFAELANNLSKSAEDLTSTELIIEKTPSGSIMETHRKTERKSSSITEEEF